MIIVQITKTLYVTNRGSWRKWLAKNHASEPELWLVYYKKETGKPRIGYNEAVEEALCFGWIDSNVKRLDSERFAQRFSPRKSKSEYSQMNKERLKKLIEQGRVIPSVLAQMPKDIFSDEFVLSPDILARIRANEQVWRNFQALPSRYKRIRLAFIEGARGRPKELEKRLDYFIRMTAKNKLFGFGGVEEYFQDHPARKN